LATDSVSLPAFPASFGHASLLIFQRQTMIQCEALTKRFGHFTAVDHVSFSVAKGSIFGFLGPNGSGKSTVIRMLCGLLEPSDGRASIAGFDVARRRKRSSLIGYMSRSFTL
jgi:ABC-type multidrug transport system ATPase subunit